MRLDGAFHISGGAEDFTFSPDQVASMLGNAISAKGEGAVGDDSTDNYAPIQRCIDKLPSGGGAILLETGVYRVNTGLSVTNPNVHFIGRGWDQSTTTAGSILKAGASMTHLVNGSSAASKMTFTDMSLDGAGNATNLVTADGLNCQFTRTYGRRPASSGVGFNVTSNGTSAWFTDCRFNGANQANCVGFSIGGTDATMSSCKAVNCLDSVVITSGGSGSHFIGNHHTPGSTIGRCCFNITGAASHLVFNGNRIDNHAGGSGMQFTPAANCLGTIIDGNEFFQNVITDNTFAAIGLDTSNAQFYQTIISNNVVKGGASNRYAALLTAQKLDGTAATNPTRIDSSGVIVQGNSVWAAAMYGTSSTPKTGLHYGNAFSTDGTTWAVNP